MNWIQIQLDLDSIEEKWGANAYIMYWKKILEVLKKKKKLIFFFENALFIHHYLRIG